MPGTRKVLTIAGSDSGGGAGIQADIKTITLLGAYATSVITAVTAQNTLGVQAIHPVPADMVAMQLDSILTDIRPDAIKTGMLCNADIAHVIAERLKRYSEENSIVLIVDPVMYAKGGALLLEEKAHGVIVKELFPLATVVTPNLAETSELAGMEVNSIGTMHEAAERIFELGPAKRPREGRPPLARGGGRAVRRTSIQRVFRAAHSDSPHSRDWMHFFGGHSGVHGVWRRPSHGGGRGQGIHFRGDRDRFSNRLGHRPGKSLRGAAIGGRGRRQQVMYPPRAADASADANITWERPMLIKALQLSAPIAASGAIILLIMRAADADSSTQYGEAFSPGHIRFRAYFAGTGLEGSSSGKRHAIRHNPGFE